MMNECDVPPIDIDKAFRKRLLDYENNPPPPPPLDEDYEWMCVLIEGLMALMLEERQRYLTVRDYENADRISCSLSHLNIHLRDDPKYGTIWYHGSHRRQLPKQEAT